MKNEKGIIFQGQSYQEIGEYWDNHDLGEVWEKTEHAEFVLSLIPAKPKDSIFELGQDPVTVDVDDASVNHDMYRHP